MSMLNDLDPSRREFMHRSSSLIAATGLNPLPVLPAVSRSAVAALTAATEIAAVATTPMIQLGLAVPRWPLLVVGMPPFLASGSSDEHSDELSLNDGQHGRLIALSMHARRTVLPKAGDVAFDPNPYLDLSRRCVDLSFFKVLGALRQIDRILSPLPLGHQSLADAYRDFGREDRAAATTLRSFLNRALAAKDTDAIDLIEDACDFGAGSLNAAAISRLGESTLADEIRMTHSKLEARTRAIGDRLPAEVGDCATWFRILQSYHHLGTEPLPLDALVTARPEQRVLLLAQWFARTFDSTHEWLSIPARAAIRGPWLRQVRECANLHLDAIRSGEPRDPRREFESSPVPMPPSQSDLAWWVEFVHGERTPSSHGERITTEWEAE